jgi:hypothetical protein
MVNTKPAPELMRQLYETMLKVQDLAPWEKMEESDMFGIQHPVTGQQGFVSVLGMAGEHFAINLYPDVNALYKLFDFVNSVTQPDTMDLIAIPQLQASLEDRNTSTKEDIAETRALGFKFRGRKFWLQFRAYAPGLFPWYLEAAEAEFLLVALEQLLEVAPRFTEDLFYPKGKNDETFFFRVPRQDNNTLIWEDQYIKVPPPKPEAKAPKIPLQTPFLKTVKALPRSKRRIELDVFSVRKPVQDGKERPYFPQVFMMVDHETGKILTTELLEPFPTLDAAYAKVPDLVITSLARQGLKPLEIGVARPFLHDLVQPIAKAAGFKVVLLVAVPTIQMLKMTMPF